MDPFSIITKDQHLTTYTVCFTYGMGKHIWQLSPKLIIKIISLCSPCLILLFSQLEDQLVAPPYNLCSGDKHIPLFLQNTFSLSLFYWRPFILTKLHSTTINSKLFLKSSSKYKVIKSTHTSTFYQITQIVKITLSLVSKKINLTKKNKFCFGICQQFSTVWIVTFYVTNWKPM